jgi:hypothetical protein
LIARLDLRQEKHVYKQGQSCNCVSRLPAFVDSPRVEHTHERQAEWPSHGRRSWWQPLHEP